MLPRAMQCGGSCRPEGGPSGDVLCQSRWEAVDPKDGGGRLLEQWALWGGRREALDARCGGSLF